MVIRVGAIALKMTGLDWEKAKFQALSAFSGTGFTTRESELIVNHPQRREIVTWLIILGNAGTVLKIVTFVVSLHRKDVLRPSINLLIIVVAVYTLYRVTLARELMRS